MFKCSLCDLIFNARYLHDRHLENAHHMNWPCPYCDIVFAKQSHFETHFRYAHKHIKIPRKNEFQCPYCKKEFSDMPATLQHFRIQLEGEKIDVLEGRPSQCRPIFMIKTESAGQFICPVCRLQLSSPYRRLCHFKDKHKLTIQCTKCDAEFLTGREVLSHHFFMHEVIKCTNSDTSLKTGDDLLVHSKEINLESNVRRML